jgi:hypothetical protein
MAKGNQKRRNHIGQGLGTKTGRDLDSELTTGLEDSFPASDPVSVTRSGEKVETADEVDTREADEQLDEALRGTFPASDPPALTSKLHPGRRRQR